MAITHVTAIRNSLADLVVDAIDAGPGAGYVNIYADFGGGLGALLAEITLSDPAFGAAAAGVATASGLPVEDSSANGTGVAAYFLVFDSDDNEVFRGTVTATGEGGDMTMVSTSLTVGEPVQITSFTYTASL